MGKIKPEFALPQKILSVEHKVWQVPRFQSPKALAPKVIKMLKERLQMRVIERYYGLYQNPWYLVKKSQPGKYQLVTFAVQLNRITIRDQNLPYLPISFQKCLPAEK